MKEPNAKPPLPPSPEEIKALRMERGLSPKNVADAFGKSVTCIYAYELGRTRIPPGLAECIKGMADPLPAPDYEIGPPVSPEELLALRTMRKLSASELSKALGISRFALRSYEKGLKPVPKGLAEKIVYLFPDAPDPNELPDPIEEALYPDDLRDLRMSRGGSQGALAKAFGTNTTTICFYETGQSPIPAGLRARILALFPEECGPKMTSEEFVAYRILSGQTRLEFASAIGSSDVSVGCYERGIREIPRDIEKR